MSSIRNIITKRKFYILSFSNIYLCSKSPPILSSASIYKMKSHFQFCSSIKSEPLENKCSLQNISSIVDAPSFVQSLHYVLDESFVLEDLDKLNLSLISERFDLKSLNTQYLLKYNVRVSPDWSTLLFPFDSLHKDMSSLQTLEYKKDAESTIFNFSSRSDEPSLFGWSLVGVQQRVVIVTSDPRDAIAVNQSTDLPAVSLPCNFTTFSPQLLESLKSCRKVIFWLRPHLHNWEVHKVLSNTLEKQAYFIRPNDNRNALFCLQHEFDIKQILNEAYPLYDENLETFESYRDKIQEELKGHEKNAGLKWKRFSVLNDLLKGHRRGELTVFSGQTGTGKTTFMSEYSLDLCMQGLPTLWASFEISNTRLMKTMLCQYSRCSLVENMESYDCWSNEFNKIPMFFLNFHSTRTLKRILKAMTNAVIVYDVQHVIVDNLQFMMNIDEYNSSLDQLRRQDQIYSAFREFATQWDCHVTLVIHPRKEPDFSELNNTSIAGTAKATQEADNILILQTTKSRQYLQVTKNRYDGHKGCIVVEFDKRNHTFNVKRLTPKPKGQDQQSTIL